MVTLVLYLGVLTLLKHTLRGNPRYIFFSLAKVNYYSEYMDLSYDNLNE